jgi:hypothetical protein
MRGTLPCTPSCIQAKPEDAARESRSDLSFSNFSAGIARRIERSPLPSDFRDGQLQLSWNARSTLSSN